MQDFLPVTKKEMQQRGWDQVDFVYLTGDAYVDHPSFGAAIISRLLESRGYRVGIIPQPDWRKKESVQVFGAPRLGFLVSAGNMDSMVNHYTVSRKHRQKDSYSPGGEMGLRPDMPTVVYSNLIRQTYKHTRSYWEGSRQAFVVLPIMTIGRIRYAAASFWIRERISFPTEWGNIRSYRSQKHCRVDFR